jgi:hypothetical protein
VIQTYSLRFFFDSVQSAAQALEIVLLDARSTPRNYRITGLSAQQILQSGILLAGELDEVAAKLKTVPGAVWYNE